MGVKVDRQDLSNLDRLNKNKMNRLRRVEELPERGGFGDWVVCQETREDVDYDCTYAWVDNDWVKIGEVARG